MKRLDFRSDTVTCPTIAMRKAMAEAAVGDDVYGEDPTVNELQAYAAELTGKEDALFVTSGTMGNLVSVLTHCKRGDGAVLGLLSHIYNFEGGGLSALGGVLPLVTDDHNGIPSPEGIREAFRSADNVHHAPARLLCLENTHNRAGGVAIAPEVFKKAAEEGRRLGLAIHLDGARLFNATTAFKVEATEYTKWVDSVQICLSKGLSAPVGSIVCAGKDFIKEARHWRKRVGGGLRQAGVLAAAGLIALREMRNRLFEDHENASLLASLLEEGGVQVEPCENRTNMVFFDLPADGVDTKELMERCKTRGLLIGEAGERRVRMVTHVDVTERAVREAARIVIEEVSR